MQKGGRGSVSGFGSAFLQILAFWGYSNLDFKLRRLLRENANIRTVFLGVGYHSFSDYYDPSILGDNSAFVSPRYVFVMPVSDKLKYSFMEAGDFSVFYPELFTLTFRYLIDDAPYDYGGFTFIETQTALTDSTIEERLNDQFFSRKSQNGFSSKNLRYFLNIIDPVRKETLSWSC